MITVDTLRQCAYLDTISLEELIRKNHPKDMVVESKFIGITNGGQFCYDILYPDDHSASGLARDKVFVWKNTDGQLVADY